MKRQMGILVALLLAMSLGAQEPVTAPEAPEAPEPAEASDSVERVVVLSLRDGSRIEGVLVEEGDDVLTVIEEQAGGTITHRREIPRAEVVDWIELDADALAERAMERAYRNLQRYRLNPTTSYPESYYPQVIDGAFRRFLQDYPESPHASVVAEQISLWQEESRRVASGEVKYQGTWRDAEELRTQLGKAQADQLLAEGARLYRARKYGQAIETVRYVDRPEAKRLTINSYHAWLGSLEAERGRIEARLQAVDDRIAQAEATKEQLQEATRRKRDGLTDGAGEWTGATQEEVMALNQATNAILAGRKERDQLAARRRVIERQIDQVRPSAEQVGVLYQPSESGGGATVVEEPIADLQSGQIERETDWNTPRLLRQIRDLWLKFWPGISLAFLAMVWYFTRRFSG